jgi:hypothetical protein
MPERGYPGQAQFGDQEKCPVSARCGVLLRTRIRGRSLMPRRQRWRRQLNLGLILLAVLVGIATLVVTALTHSAAVAIVELSITGGLVRWLGPDSQEPLIPMEPCRHEEAEMLISARSDAARSRSKQHFQQAPVPEACALKLTVAMKTSP